MKLEDVLRHKKFVDFLKKHKAFDSYRKNSKNQNKFTVEGSSDYINEAFIWKKTSEGSEFWTKLYYEWEIERLSKLEKYLEGIDTAQQDVVE